MKLLAAAADDLSIDMVFEPGDIQIVSNHAALHSRAAFKDSSASSRHLLRMWLTTGGAGGTTGPLPALLAALEFAEVVSGLAAQKFRVWRGCQ